MEELWKEYRLLTGLEEPYVNALRLSKDIVLDHLLHLKERTRPPKISCYLDLQDHLRAAEVSEKLLLLEAAERVRSRIRGEEWRRLLAEELECSRAGWEKALENLSEALRRSEKNAILYGGVVRPLREHLERDGYRVSLIYLQPYWRSPLDVLRMMVLEHGMDGVSDEIFEECIRKHLRYLDYVVYSEDLDSAHNRWARETIPSVYPY